MILTNTDWIPMRILFIVDDTSDDLIHLAAWLQEKHISWSILKSTSEFSVEEYYRDNDIVITDCIQLYPIVQKCKIFCKPLVYRFRNQIDIKKLDPRDINLLIFDLYHSVNTSKYLGPQLILYPFPHPSYSRKHAPDQGFINILENPSQDVTIVELIDALNETIPLITKPTYELKEYMGDSLIYIDLSELELVNKWATALARKDVYQKYVDKLSERHAFLKNKFLLQLDSFIPALESLQTNGKKVNFIASEIHYADHLAPYYDALPPLYRGLFITEMGINNQLLEKGLVTVPILQELNVLERFKSLSKANSITVISSSKDLEHAEHRLRRNKLIMVEHGAGQTYLTNHAAYAGGPDREGLIGYLGPGPHPIERQKTQYPRIPAKEIGCPKLDAWLRITNKKEKTASHIIAISFHWRGTIKGIPEVSSAVDYFFPQLNILKDKYTILGHAHPRIADELRPKYATLGIPFIEDFNDILEQADLLVIDNSSVLFEYSAVTSRPVVLLNSPVYRKAVEHGLRFWECADIGVQCDIPNKLDEAVQEALNWDKAKQLKQIQALAKVYTFLDGNSAAKGAKALVQSLHLIESRSQEKQIKVRANSNFVLPDVGEVRQNDFLWVKESVYLQLVKRNKDLVTLLEEIEETKSITYEDINIDKKHIPLVELKCCGREFINKKELAQHIRVVHIGNRC